MVEGVRQVAIQSVGPIENANELYWNPNLLVCVHNTRLTPIKASAGKMFLAALPTVR